MTDGEAVVTEYARTHPLLAPGTDVNDTEICQNHLNKESLNENLKNFESLFYSMRRTQGDVSFAIQEL